MICLLLVVVARLEADGYAGIALNRRAVHCGGLVTPVSDGRFGRLGQKRVSADHANFFHRAVLRYRDIEHDCAAPLRDIP